MLAFADNYVGRVRRREMLSRYNLILASATSLSNLLTPAPRIDPDMPDLPSDVTRAELRALRDREWKKTLSKALVSPVLPIPPEQDNIRAELLAPIQVHLTSLLRCSEVYLSMLYNRRRQLWLHTKKRFLQNFPTPSS